ncbi:MAG: guanylate kinase [Eubacterium sp.]|nr:guanylate kinase [Eubacterium sp.]
MKRKGTLVVISGFSGAGKGTISRKLVEKYGYSLSVSATTRDPRQGEVDGVDYFFRTQAEFLKMIDYNGLIEYARYVDHYYGTPRKFVEDELEAGHVVILEIEVQGALKIREQYPDAVLVFVTAPSAEVLRKRLAGRGTESPEQIEKRMRRAAEEADTIENYEYLVCNHEGRLDECTETIHAIIESHACRTVLHEDFIREMKEGLRGC